MDPTMAESIALKAELDRVKEATEVDEEYVRDLEERVIEFVTKNRRIISMQYMEELAHLKMVKLIDAQLKLVNDRIAEKKEASLSQSMHLGDNDKKN
ncbi:unnamed protein product [Arabis nemorensis]|uniref:Uncharacterized protein n=1 Tax=Arabis nemorensis TaxID=586526 RepID=A0A565C3E8_9BRAS|nr:unnamed protein product [Arabis nemorensis]